MGGVLSSFYWFFVIMIHLTHSTMVSFMDIREICSAINPIERYICLQSKLPKQSFLDWANFIRTLTPNQIEWQINWLKIDKANITSQEGNAIELLGLSGGTAYYPLKVIK